MIVIMIIIMHYLWYNVVVFSIAACPQHKGDNLMLSCMSIA